MNFRYLAFLVIILVAGAAFANTKLKKFSITKEISVMLPQDFLPMPDDGIARKYPSTTKPLAVYTSPNGQIDFSVTQKRSRFKENDLQMLREFYKASLTEKFTKVDFIREEIASVKGKDHIIFEFVSTLADTRQGSNLAPVQRYSIVQYAVQGDQLLIFTFHVPFMLKKDWQPIAQEVMSSIKVK
ncbi:hypothetical protein FVR03_18150 [Pontibacter qinzhouensis]|uniref:DUF1795 domain-containing protein n=1 Tax=Pontibacter qinzhouensis TaxID=2603253 RepID=A0A5C8JA82_9BACT|nr:hypothetical protein [Pontibacter qinzhouensis]TXK33883.1 hypothetical protein FVR03_18150 [Pontibacter qinzhouensis]